MLLTFALFVDGCCEEHCCICSCSCWGTIGAVVPPPSTVSLSPPSSSSSIIERLWIVSSLPAIHVLAAVPEFVSRTVRSRVAVVVMRVVVIVVVFLPFCGGDNNVAPPLSTPSFVPPLMPSPLMSGICCSCRSVIAGGADVALGVPMPLVGGEVDVR